jgi:hypothetical protein
LNTGQSATKIERNGGGLLKRLKRSKNEIEGEGGREEEELKDRRSFMLIKAKYITNSLIYFNI